MRSVLISIFIATLVTTKAQSKIYTNLYENNEINSDTNFNSLNDFYFKDSLPSNEYFILNKTLLKPIHELSIGYNKNSPNLTSNAILGFQMAHNFSKKWGVDGLIYGGGSITPFSDSLRSMNVLPNNFDFRFGQNFYLRTNFRISFEPNKYLRTELGYGRNHIGCGYESLILSDKSTAYPYIKLQASFWKFKYQILYGFGSNTYNRNSTPYKLNKAFTTHLFSYQIIKGLNLDLFESIVWPTMDSKSNVVRGVQFAYLNPIIFFRPVESWLGSPDNSMVGIGLNYNFGKLNIYSQFLLDELVVSKLFNGSKWWGNKWALQLGVRGKSKLSEQWGINYLAELNLARPYTYQHVDLTLNHAVQGKSMGLSFGANSLNINSNIQFTFKEDFKFNISSNIVLQGLDTSATTNYGTNVQDNYNDRGGDEDQLFFQPTRQIRAYSFIEAEYYMTILKTSMFLHLGLQNQKSLGNLETNVNIQLGIRSSLFSGQQVYH
jgi:hypothetical protein